MRKTGKSSETRRAKLAGLEPKEGSEKEET